MGIIISGTLAGFVLVVLVVIAWSGMWYYFGVRRGYYIGRRQ